MVQWGFYFNQDRCLGCKTCVIACKNWNETRRGDSNVNIMNFEKNMVAVNERDKGASYTDPVTGTSNYDEYRKYYMKENWRRVEAQSKGRVSVNADGTFETNLERAYLSLSCNHCVNPTCVAVCPNNAIYKEEKFGLTLVNNEVCISCGRCQDACPWNAPQYYRDDYANFPINDPKRPRMTKCTGCLDRIKEGLKPACVAACWNRALDAGPIEELKEKYQSYRQTIEGFNSDYIAATGEYTKPNIIFKPKS